LGYQILFILRGDIYLGLRLVYFNYFGLVLAWVDYYLNWTYVRPLGKLGFWLGVYILFRNNFRAYFLWYFQHCSRLLGCSILVLDWTFNSSKKWQFFVVNLYFFCSSPGIGVVIELVYILVVLEQVFHCDKLIQISTNLD